MNYISNIINKKRKISLIEMVIFVFFMGFFSVFIAKLVTTIAREKRDITFKMERININSVINANYTKMICFYNKNDIQGIASEGKIIKDEVYVSNTNNTDEETDLCNEIKGTFNGYTDPTVEQFYLLRNNFKNIATYKLVYVLNNGDNDILRIGTFDLRGFLESTNTSLALDELIKESIEYKFKGKDITDDKYGYYYDKITFNLIDDKMSEGDEYFYNYYLIQAFFSKRENTHTEYYLFSNQ